MEEKLGGAIEEVRTELENPETYDKIAKHVQDAVGRTLKAWWANKFGQSKKAVDEAMEQMPDMPFGLRLLKTPKEDRMALIVGYVAEQVSKKQVMVPPDQAMGPPNQADIPSPEEYRKSYEEAYGNEVGPENQA